MLAAAVEDTRIPSHMAEIPEEIDYESLPNSSLAVNALAGALAGISEHAVMYPIDSIKTRMQVLSPHPTAIYSGLANALKRIASTEGLPVLWRGLASVVVGAGPAHAIYFATYEFGKESLGVRPDGHYPLQTALSGAAATIASDGFMNPFDVIKQRMQVHGSTFKSSFSCGMHILRTEGIRAFYVSYPTTLTMTVPFHMVHFSAYETLRKLLSKPNEYDPLSHIASGGIAGGIAAAITTPLDVTKTLLQTRGASKDAVIQSASGMTDAFKIIYERQGLIGFTRGMTARVFAHMPSTAICWTTVSPIGFLLDDGG